MGAIELGEKINNAGREFKAWFTDFTLVYSPIFIVLGLILTGLDLFLNLGLSASLWFRIPWSIAQLFAVDGLWFAVWNRILTDEYKWTLVLYHVFIIALGLAMTAIAITMNYIIFTQDYMGLRDSVAAMNFVGIPVGLFLFVRSVLLMLTATLAIVLDKVMRFKPRYSKRSSKPEPATVVVPADKPTVLALPEPADEVHSVDGLAIPKGVYREMIRIAIHNHVREGRPYTYKDIAAETGASLQTVKVYAPKIKQELAEKE